MKIMHTGHHDYLATGDVIIDYLHDNIFKPIQVKDLCHITGKSERTLERICIKIFALTPRALIRKHRLNDVRKSLKKIPTGLEGTVTEVAIRHGFFHLGRFSAEYKKHFGELPSETIRNNNPAAL